MWVSYSLWREFSPQLGYETNHCHKKRWFKRIKKITELDNDYQKVGKLAQKIVYHLYQNPQYLNIESIDLIMFDQMNLKQESEIIQSKIFDIINFYIQKPFLLDKKVVEFDSGNDTKPNKININSKLGNYVLYYLFDCIIEDEDQVLHIIDFKTGNSKPDIRQAYVYLLVADYLSKSQDIRYKNKLFRASFYNLETGKQSSIYTLDREELELFKDCLGKIAFDHDQEKKKYQQKEREYFDQPEFLEKFTNKNFPASVGNFCQNCAYNNHCEDYQEYYQNESK
jgi:hypothetical protein